MKQILYDKKIDQKFRYYDGKPYIVDIYEVTSAPDNIRCIEDLLFLVIRKYNVPLNRVEGTDREDLEPLKSFIIKTPFSQSVTLRLQSKFNKWCKNPNSVDLNEAELEFFKLAFEQKNANGQPLPLSKISLTLGLPSRLNSEELSPLNMKGFPEDE